jgi:hypothetical protein
MKKQPSNTTLTLDELKARLREALAKPHPIPPKITKAELIALLGQFPVQDLPPVQDPPA